MPSPKKTLKPEELAAELIEALNDEKDQLGYLPGYTLSEILCLARNINAGVQRFLERRPNVDLKKTGALFRANEVLDEIFFALEK